MSISVRLCTFWTRSSSTFLISCSTTKLRCSNALSFRATFPFCKVWLISWRECLPPSNDKWLVWQSTQSLWLQCEHSTSGSLLLHSPHKVSIIPATIKLRGNSSALFGGTACLALHTGHSMDESRISVSRQPLHSVWAQGSRRGSRNISIQTGHSRCLDILDCLPAIMGSIGTGTKQQIFNVNQWVVRLLMYVVMMKYPERVRWLCELIVFINMTSSRDARV